MLEEEFIDLGKQGFNKVPIVMEKFADLDTPLSVYLKAANNPYTYLLESVHGGERFGRYSFVGLSAKTQFCVYGKTCLEVENGEIVSEKIIDEPLDWIREIQKKFKAKIPSGLPRFLGGLVGYFGYETIKFIEKRLNKPDKPDVLGTPDIMLLLSEELIIVDNLASKLYIVVYANPTEKKSLQSAKKRLREIDRLISKPIIAPFGTATKLDPVVTEFGKTNFVEAVRKAKAYITEGDIMQVVLSQRMNVAFDAEPLALYRALRALNPSPYMFFFNMKDFHIIGSSPEILVRLEGDLVTLRPIAGTRPRGASEEEDINLEEDLLSDPKELAEHVMLLDLGRNDVGRVAQIGSVGVTEKMIVEKYSHVMHIVSNVEGKLNKDLDAIAVLKASFPAGTVSGAPKVRAMEIVEELEPTKRGIYSGAVGYLDFGGNMDVAIAIRTAVIQNSTLYIQAGAGIVADSDPTSEWVETQNKAKAILKAAEIAVSGSNSKIIKDVREG